MQVIVTLRQFWHGCISSFGVIAALSKPYSQGFVTTLRQQHSNWQNTCILIIFSVKLTFFSRIRWIGTVTFEPTSLGRCGLVWIFFIIKKRPLIFFIIKKYLFLNESAVLLLIVEIKKIFVIIVFVPTGRLLL